MFLPQEGKFVNLSAPKDLSSSAISTTYVDMTNYNQVHFVVYGGAVGAIGSSISVSLKEAASTSGSSSANLAMNEYWTNTAALSSASTANDSYVKTSVSSSGNSFKLVDSQNSQVHIIPVHKSQLSSGKTSAGVGVGATAASAIVGIAAILSDPVHAAGSPPSAL